jgi:Holliday junction resolvase
MELSFWVQGRPAAQGSKRHVGNGRMVEASRFVAPWRAAVTAAAIEVSELEGWQKQSGPMSAHMVFHIARPASVKESDRPLPIKPPDLDKLVRAVCDSLTDADVWEDDAQLVSLTCEKQYVKVGEDGVSIHVKSFEVN